MLSRLLLMRHAKSSWKHPELTDHQRPLNARGRKAAKLIAQTLSAQGQAPDIIWSSDAERTRETAQRLIRHSPGAQIVHYIPEFYHASAETVLGQSAHYEEPEGTLMLLGHNPGWAALYTYFSGQVHPFPTAACAIFQRLQKPKNGEGSAREPEWLDPKHWRLSGLLLPRDLDRES